MLYLSDCINGVTFPSILLVVPNQAAVRRFVVVQLHRPNSFRSLHISQLSPEQINRLLPRGVVHGNALLVNRGVP